MPSGTWRACPEGHPPAGGDVSVTFADVADRRAAPERWDDTHAATVPVVTGVPIVAATMVHTGRPSPGPCPW